MKVKNKKQKGFIQIPILIAIIVGVIAIGTGYFIIKTYKAYSDKSTTKQNIGTQEEQHQGSEIEKLKTEVEGLKKALTEQNQQKLIKSPSTPSVQVPYSVATVIEQWRPKIAYIVCAWETIYGDNVYSSGSGLFVSPGVITNEHVIVQKDISGVSSVANFCTVKLPEDSEVFINREDIYNWGNNKDIGALVVKNPTDKMNKVASELSPMCRDTAAIGERLLVLGYPITGSTNDITVTEGIISGYDGDFYITSAKIEKGNSGGAAILVDKNCYLGIPTFAAVGEVESLGRVLDARTLLQ